MTITLEQIDQVINRTHVDYATAKKALEAHDGNLVEAIIAIENDTQESTSKKVDTEAWQNKVKWALKQLCKAIEFSLNIKVIWKKNDVQLLEVPLLVLALFILWLMPFSLIVLAIPFFFGIKLYIKNGFGKTNEISQWLKDHTNS